MNIQATTMVSMIGLGNMGHALADSLLAKAFQVTAWNRTRSKAQPLERAGASVAPSVEAAAQGTDVMVICLIDHAATREAVMTKEVGAALRGKSLVQLSTTLANEVDELARWAESYDIAFLKGAIMVYPDDIRAGNGEILYGGPKHLFDRLQPVLDAMGGRPCLVCDRPADTIALTSASYSLPLFGLAEFSVRRGHLPAQRCFGRSLYTQGNRAIPQWRIFDAVSRQGGTGGGYSALR